MWWRSARQGSRRALLIGALGLVAACAMTPAYGPGGTGSMLRGHVSLRAPESIDDFLLNRHLSDRLGPDDAPVYALDYRLTTATVGQGITPDDVTTRYSLNGTADFALTEIATGATVTKGRVSSFTSYSAMGTTITTTSAERDAHERLMVMLADQIMTRLLAGKPKPAP
ncbi:MAG: LPS assembly lipoprotein LptE [Paracoccus sp. (in: a-proteobacteria)]